MRVGKIIRSLRHNRGITLHQVAVKTNIDSPLLSKIERGERLPTNQQIEKLSSFFNIDKAELEVKCTAEKILRSYGENGITYEAAVLVQEALQDYSMKKPKNE